MVEDLYPVDTDEYAKLRTWCLDAWLAAVNARQPHEKRWDRYDKLYEAFINKDRTDWRSRVFMPEVFTQIETIKPRLIQNLPKFLVHPVGKEDIETANLFESVMEWAAHTSKLHLELVKTFHPTLLYGTGILKTFPDTRYAFGSEMVPVFETETQILRKPLIDPETQRQMVDADNQPMFSEEPMTIEIPVGMESQKKRFVTYDGPAAKAVNIKNFWPAPEAEDVQTARYVIHRVYKDFSEVKRLIAEGVYRFPEELTFDDLWTQHDDPRIVALGDLNLSVGPDPTRKQLELLEFWVNDGPGRPGRVITIANRKAILRVHENPFWHGQKPFIRFVDYMKPHHFWGIGEVQHMEGIQDAINAIVNQRIDNGRLGMDQGYVVNKSLIKDRRQLVRRPGQTIEVEGDGVRPNEAIWPIPTTEVTQTSFAEVAELQKMGERTSAVSSYQQGIDTPAQLETATGAAMMHEAGSSRFALKAKLFEIDPLETLSLHFGSLLQQFVSTERIVRLVGADGGARWETIGPESLQGSFDFSVESMASQQSETVKRQQALDIFQQTSQAVSMQALPPEVAVVAFKDLLEAMGAKSVLRSLEEITQQQQAQPELPEAPVESMASQ